MSDAAEAAKKARMTAYQRWEMASFDPVPADRSAADQAALEKHLRRVRDEAHAQGLASGHVAGQAMGYKAGYDQGYEQGLEEGRRESRAEAARLAQMADTFKTALQAADAVVAEALTALALDIAQQVVSQHLTLDPTAVLAVARSVIAAEPALAGAPYLTVNPADLPIVEAYLLEELQAAGWAVRTDPDIERGGCRAQAASGEVDATNKTRWERVAAALGRSQPW
ncbi:flagellar assembly protein FliH [Burkholderia sp. D7]|uniref:Flagellar assembly protein FliH n=1 Tax=Caballeronia udeis TaxID=1232866 RepID=A0A158G870_9BURK|nr:flagellar assembly protein FliH [Caballeronia udeis]SAL28305.1 flagellar assembly protein H [Caballeronia udeis]SOE47832.1 flagellar assembly protein FliH [Burkholderia sp. D7]